MSVGETRGWATNGFEEDNKCYRKGVQVEGGGKGVRDGVGWNSAIIYNTHIGRYDELNARLYVTNEHVPLYTG